MKRTTSVVGVGAALVGFALAGCSITIGSTRQASPAASSGLAVIISPTPVSSASPSKTTPSDAPPSTSAAGATYLALVVPVNTATFALDTAVFGSTDDLTANSLGAAIVSSLASIKTFNDQLLTVAWPRTAVPDVTTLASANDMLVSSLQGFESELQSPVGGADFNTVLQDLRSKDSSYRMERGVAFEDAARLRSDLGLPPPPVPQATLNG
ncbi:MAG TPA: hypothetical protein VK662_14205 [Acidothermaceae bacterium]|jgi:hypothetical protein|nr:hypothetical protein [Acidothermaceae bacterium]